MELMLAAAIKPQPVAKPKARLHNDVPSDSEDSQAEDGQASLNGLVAGMLQKLSQDEQDR